MCSSCSGRVLHEPPSFAGSRSFANASAKLGLMHAGRIRLAGLPSLNFGDAHAASRPGIPTVRSFSIKAAIAETE